MATAPLPEPVLPPAPWPALRAALLAHAEEHARAGDELGAARVRALADEWWAEQCAWVEQMVETLRLHHEVNNALVGVSGNAQLLLLGPAGGQPGVRERLEIVLREARRIEVAVRRLRALRVALEPAAGGPRPGGEP